MCARCWFFFIWLFILHHHRSPRDTCAWISAWMRVRMKCVCALRIRIALKTYVMLENGANKNKRKKLRERQIKLRAHHSHAVLFDAQLKLVQNHFEPYYKWQTNYFTVDLLVHHNILLLLFAPFIDSMRCDHTAGYFNAMTLIFMRASFDPDAFHTRRRIFYLRFTIGYRFLRAITPNTNVQTPIVQR